MDMNEVNAVIVYILLPLSSIKWIPSLWNFHGGSDRSTGIQMEVGRNFRVVRVVRWLNDFLPTQFLDFCQLLNNLIGSSAVLGEEK